MDGWKTILSFWGPAYFQGELLVSGRVFFLSLKKCCLEYNWTCSKSDLVISFLPQDLFKSPGILRAWKDPSLLFWNSVSSTYLETKPPHSKLPVFLLDHPGIDGNPADSRCFGTGEGQGSRWNLCSFGWWAGGLFWVTFWGHFSLGRKFGKEYWVLGDWRFFGVCGCHSWFQGISYHIYHIMSYHIT